MQILGEVVKRTHWKDPQRDVRVNQRRRDSVDRAITAVRHDRLRTLLHCAKYGLADVRAASGKHNAPVNAG